MYGKLQQISRVLIVLSAVSLVPAFTAPLWSYGFSAPQYPEGLMMWIYANHISGRVDLINELNHYIGMHDIVESGFVELKIIPVLLAFLIVSALAVALFGGLRSLLAWQAFFAISGLALLGDFYHWLYVYGHDLDPHAAIKIPPFTPHLIGAYMFLNFHIMAWPDWGAFAMVFSFVLGGIALVWELAHLSARASLGISGTANADRQERSQYQSG
jgi:copper chaperone NosL